MQTSHCKLCGKEAKLIKAHIIPKQMLKDIFDEAHSISTLDFKHYGKTTRHSDVAYDLNLFCKLCDGDIIGSYESYFASVILRKGAAIKSEKIIQKDCAKSKDIELIELSGLDYHKLKLFFLSLLLRSSLSTQVFFKDVDVKKFHEDLKKMIISGVACGEDRFRIVMYKIIPDGNKPYHMVIGPMKQKVKGNTFYTFYINTYIIFINISEYNISDIFRKNYLRESGVMPIGYFSGRYAAIVFEKLIGREIWGIKPFKAVL